MSKTSTNKLFERFENSRKIFHGIAEHYNSNVVPLLENLDKKRETTHQTAISIQLLIIFISLITIYSIPDQFGLLGIFFPITLTIIIMAWAWEYSTKSFKLDAKQTLIGGVISFFGWTYSALSTEPDIFKRLKQLKVFGSFDDKSFSDKIEGIAFGHKFTFLEIFLTQTENTMDSDGGTETHTVTVFSGCLISIKVPQQFNGETLVLRRRQLINRKTVKGLKRVGLASSKFEKNFIAYGTDQVEARYLLQPTVIEQVIAYEKAFKGKNVQFAFIQGHLHIVVETGNRFEFKKIYESMLDYNRISVLLNEIESTFNLIEGLLVKTPSQWKIEFGHDPHHTQDELKDFS